MVTQYFVFSFLTQSCSHKPNLLLQVQNCPFPCGLSIWCLWECLTKISVFLFTSVTSFICFFTCHADAQEWTMASNVSCLGCDVSFCVSICLLALLHITELSLLWTHSNSYALYCDSRAGPSTARGVWSEGQNPFPPPSSHSARDQPRIHLASGLQVHVAVSRWASLQTDEKVVHKEKQGKIFNLVEQIAVIKVVSYQIALVLRSFCIAEKKQTQRLY